MIRVLVVDDQLVVRRGLRVILQDFPDIDVAGEAVSGPAALAAVQELRPDVVLMDVRMPDGDGIAATRALATASEPVPVIVLTTFAVDEYVFGALEAGAVGFLLKDDAEPDDLAAAVRAAARGDGLVSPSVTRRVIAEFARRGSLVPADPGPGRGAEVLTRRELDIVRALSQGHSNEQIAQHLHLEAGTVKAHLSRIMAKLEVQGRVQVVIWAFRNGVVA
ncbi:response regulator [Cellulomonas soli]|uniref:DNA-binding response regulator n=1 Tax=Cellulomonas soli TaxID=931535 RepID=A0A512P9C3_9CELL|nr:response regulator transcription factor [Cellulomonas soli]NYI60279.1 DNA-binding NarL/FixJ family response regulator [Cellulomonas soli]GEP67790.1 DNA-binding response regulator [Cellulomonas soli]